MKWILIPLLIILHTIIRAETVEFSRSLVPIGNAVIYTVSVTDDSRQSCIGFKAYSFQEGGICFFPGLHVARVIGLEQEPDVVLFGIDGYARVRGGPMSIRLGLGLSFVDKKVPEQMETPWVARLSLQGQWNYKDWFPFFNFSHWSNGRGGAERLGIERFWPQKNGGGNAFSLGFGVYF